MKGLLHRRGVSINEAIAYVRDEHCMTLWSPARYAFVSLTVTKETGQNRLRVKIWPLLPTYENRPDRLHVRAYQATCLRPKTDPTVLRARMTHGR